MSSDTPTVRPCSHRAARCNPPKSSERFDLERGCMLAAHSTSPLKYRSACPRFPPDNITVHKKQTHLTYQMYEELCPMQKPVWHNIYSCKYHGSLTFSRRTHPRQVPATRKAGAFERALKGDGRVGTGIVRASQYDPESGHHYR